VLVAIHVVIREYTANIFDALLNGRLIVGGRVLAKQVLKHVARNYRVASNGLNEVFAHDDTVKILVDLLVERRLFRGFNRDIDFLLGSRGQIVQGIVEI
jgi:hypothetical protein